MADFGNPYIGGQGALVRPSIHSPNFVSGSTGWTINKDGSFEFNGGTFRGTIVITSGFDLLVYSTPTPQANKLLIAVAGSAGNDGLGNSWIAGFNLYDAAGVNTGLWNAAGFKVINDSGGVQKGSVSIISNTGNRSPHVEWDSGGGVAAQNAFISAPSNGTSDILLIQGSWTAADPTLSAVDIIMFSSATSNGANGALEWAGGAGGSSIYDAVTWGSTGAAVLGKITAVTPGSSAPPTPESWHNAVLSAGFANAGGSNAPAGYQFVGINGGRVALRGRINLTANEAGGTVVFTLPVGYRPAFNQELMGSNNLSSITAGRGPIGVHTDGTVILLVAGVNGNFLELNGIEFELD